MFDPQQIRTHFPIFSHRPELIYLDNAATTQKPISVIRAISDFYEKENTNVHRGIYEMAASTSQKYEEVRQKTADFIGAAKKEEIVFTSGTTASINLVAQSFLIPRLETGDEVVISMMEHHVNLIPWQQACKLKGAKLVVAPINKAGELDLKIFKSLLSERTKLVAVTHVSNTLGTINPIGEILEMAHKRDIPVLVDGAQSAAHFDIDVEAWDVDFFVFSGHKMYGPTGVGILYGKEEHFTKMLPVHFGGNAIREVRFEETVFALPPRCFEPGTPNIAGVIGFGQAIDFVSSFDKKGVKYHLQRLTELATEKLQKVKGVKIVGTAKNKSPVISFTLGNVHPHDVATFLGAENIAVRAGHHCTQPLMDFYKIPGTSRISFAIYNTMEEVERMAIVIKEIQRFFNGR